MAHITAIEAALGLELDHKRKLRPKPDLHPKPSAILAIELDDRPMSPSTDERRPIKHAGKASACKTNHGNLFPTMTLIHELIPH
ncbi:hypothetical protein H8B02_35610 [Bradyrhizobium sp. Pear77]|uniref:hypothetical protein n=1 Tax=Bradyrhizobium TaxID=374 RepID=UPI001E286695|nr:MULTISPECIES: hypothetical protein [Bradyrhizobium]MCC8958561.1 hypothetical protein [Bradyrhizobium altum]MCC8967077.1 hypothetical protein [Bradyrhizobium oropedii]